MGDSAALRDLVRGDRVHVFDGAMGTALYAKGVFVNVCYDALAVERPELVRGIHEAYAAAGAEILETNTFGANPVKLSGHGLGDRTEEINRAAARLARKAAGGAFVVGAIGPLGVRIEPWGPTSADEAAAFFGRQVEGLLEGGVDGFVLETFSDLQEVEAAVGAVRALSDAPIFAQMTVGDDGRTSYGSGPETVIEALGRLDVDVAGLNCSVGPATILDAMEVIAPIATLPLSAQPNAGLPKTVRDRKMYMASPEYMAQYARRLMDAGVRFLGGCCGTTPDHIRLIAGTVRSRQPRHRVSSTGVSNPPESATAAPSIPVEKRSIFGAALARGDFLTTVELLPPHGWDTADLVGQAQRARNEGVHAVNLVDNPRGQSRMSAIASGLMVQQQASVEAIVHYTCRDKNMMGMISDLLGAAAGGIRNLLLLSGDPPTEGPYSDSNVIFDIDSIGLTNVVDGLNRGLDPGGNSIGTPTRFVIGVAINPGAVDRSREIERFAWKVQAGAEFAVTQPVFDAEALHDFLELTREWPIPILAGIWPPTSLRNAEFLANEVPGVVVPEEVLDRMRDAERKGPGHAAEEGITLACELMEIIRPWVRGIHLSAPGGDVRHALRVLEGGWNRP